MDRDWEDVARGLYERAEILDLQGQHKAALKLCEKAARLGDPDAAYWCHMDALTRGDQHRADAYLKRAAELGHADAVAELALIPRHVEIERAPFEKAAEAGDTEAMHTLGALAHKAGDDESARAWWEKAAEAGHAEAVFILGVLAHEAGDVETARSWYEKAAEAGQAGAMYGLGLLAYKAGDVETARAWFEKASELGFAEAKAALAELGG